MKKVLLIDDMSTVLVQARQIMESRYELITSDDVNEALRLVREKKPDIVLVDMYLEEDGAYELLSQLKEDGEICDIPVLFTGCDVSVMALAKAFSRGVNDFVKKPFVDSIVFKKIEEQVKLSEIGYKYGK